MADAQISVELTANIQGFVNNLNTAERAAAGTGATVTGVTGNISRNVAALNGVNMTRFTQSLRQGEISLRNISTQSTTASRSLAALAATSATSGRAVATGANQAGQALMNVGRVAQDSAYGFIGIANNLNPLLESFQRLRAESGSNAAALRALGGSLMGVGGVGLALSLVTAALQFGAIGFRAWTGETKAAKEAAEDYVATLDAVSQAQIKGYQNAQKDIASLNSLYAATQNVKLSTEERVAAVDELQKLYPAYFKNIKDESFLAGAAAGQYQILSQAIIATARARAAEDDIAKKASSQYEAQRKLNDEKQTQVNLENKLAAVRKQEFGGLAGAQNKLFAEGAIREKITESVYKQLELRNQVSRSDAEILAITEEIARQREKGVVVEDKEVARVQAVTKAVKELKTEVLTLADPKNKSIAGTLATFYTPTSGPQKIKPGLTGQAGSRDMITAEQRAILEGQEKFNKDFASLTEQGLSSSLSNMSSSIAEALAEGGSVIDAIGSSILEGFSGFLEDFGDLLIKYGTAAVAKGLLDKAVLIPGAGIVAGAAAIAAGVVLKTIGASFAKVLSRKDSPASATAFAQGGLVYGPTLGLVGEGSGTTQNNPEVISPLDKLNGYISRNIRNTLNSSLGSMKGYNMASARVSGGVGNVRAMGGEVAPVVLGLNTYIEGEKLRLVVKRAEDRLGRQ